MPGGLMPGSGGGGSGSSSDDDDDGPIESFVDWTTRNTDTHVSGTSVSREQAANVGAEMGYDPENMAGVEDYDPETGDVETDHPDWRDDWQDTAEEADETTQETVDFVTGDKFERYIKIAVAVVGVGGALYLLQPILRIVGGVVGE